MLASDLGQPAQTGDVASGPAEAGDQPSPYRIADGREHDRDRHGGRLRSARPVASNQLHGQLGQSLRMSFGRLVLERHVLALGVAQLAQPLQQRLHRRGVLPGSEGEEAARYDFPACCASAPSGAARRAPVTDLRNAVTSSRSWPPLVRPSTATTERGAGRSRTIEDLPNLPSQGLRAERLGQDQVSRLEPRTA